MSELVFMEAKPVENFPPNVLSTFWTMSFIRSSLKIVVLLEIFIGASFIFNPCVVLEQIWYGITVYFWHTKKMNDGAYSSSTPYPFDLQFQKLF